MEGDTAYNVQAKIMKCWKEMTRKPDRPYLLKTVSKLASEAV